MRSHLFTRITTDRPLSWAYPAIAASSALTPSVASITIRAMSAASRCFLAITTDSFSAMRCVFPLRRIPAALVGIPCDRGIESAHAFGRIDHHQSDVGGFQVLSCHYYRQLLSHEVRLPLAPNTGRSRGHTLRSRHRERSRLRSHRSPSERCRRLPGAFLPLLPTASQP